MNSTARQAAGWLKAEIDAGRLAPELDAAELATVASILTNGAPKVAPHQHENKEAAGGPNTATSA